MKTKTAFQTMLVLLTLIVLIIPVVSASAQEIKPPDGVTFPTPEIASFVKELATRGAWLMLVVVLDLVLGVTLALKSKTFEWQRLADFLGDYGPKVIAWLCLELLNLLPPDLAAIGGVINALGIGAYSIILISAVGSILANVQSLGLLPVKLPGVKGAG